MEMLYLTDVSSAENKILQDSNLKLRSSKMNIEMLFYLLCEHKLFKLREFTLKFQISFW